MISPAVAISFPFKEGLLRIRALAMCPQMIPGTKPKTAHTEQSSDAMARME
jgi:hypothetical protein